VHVALVDPLATTPPYDHELAGSLARRGHTVDLLTSPFPFGPVPAPDGYRRDEVFLTASGRILRRHPRSRLRFALKGLEYPPSVARMWLRLRQLDPDLVHVQWLPLPRLDLWWLTRLAASRPTVFTAHHALPRDEGAAMDARLRVYEAVARVVVHSRRVLEELVALGVPRERLAYVPHPVFATAAGGLPEPPSGPTLLFFGLLRAYKGLDVLVRALPLVPGARLVVAGDPVDPVEPVRRLAEATGVADRIEWRLGFLPDAEVDALMREAAVIVLPYRRTDASGVLATAIGHGRPAVVSDVGSLGETVRDFGAGEVVPPGDHEALAAACARLLGDADRLAAAYRGALAARAALTWDAAAEAHERLYEEVLGA
jgi:glycosyltransferase involved in cell wall biosynthesis